MTVKAIIFDFGEVLDVLEDPAPWIKQRDDMAQKLGLNGEAMWELLYKNELWEKLKRGRIDDIAYWDGILRPFGYTDTSAQQAFADQLFEGRAQVNPAMRALLLELRPHYKLAVLSNTHLRDMGNWLIDKHGLDGIFDVVVGSAGVDLAKPEAEIYHLVLDRLGVAPGEAIFIDDRERNTSAAEALGLPSIIFKSPSQLRHELASRGILAQEPQNP